jgi:hypothetical protein
MREEQAQMACEVSWEIFRRCRGQGNEAINLKAAFAGLCAAGNDLEPHEPFPDVAVLSGKDGLATDEPVIRNLVKNRRKE